LLKFLFVGRARAVHSVHMDLNSGEAGEHIAPRRPFNPLAPTRPDVIHCYGVDFLSTKEVLEMFSKFDPKSVEWLDDSACNLVFENDVCLPKVFEALGSNSEQSPEQEPWRLTIPLVVGSQKPAKKTQNQNRPQRAPRKVVLQLRPATEADRKEARHSGHTDSVYYEHVKEQQVLDKLQNEGRRAKKRVRQERFNSNKDTQSTEKPSAQTGCTLPTTDADKSTSISTAGDTDMPPASTEKGGQGSATTPSPTGPTRLGTRGLLDPLLFLRAASGAVSIGDSAGDGSCASAGVEDLAVALQKAEAEYAFLPQMATTLGSTPTPQGTPRGRPEDRKDAKERGRKRRPVSQEPRAVVEGLAAMPPPRRVQAFPEVEAFLRSKRVRCKRHLLKRTFRSIIYGRQQKQKAGKPIDKDLPPWEQYIASNGCSVGQLMHTVAWDVEGRWILTVVPHPSQVDPERMAKAIQKPPNVVRQRKLAEISKETGFPVFVCVPFGHPKDAEGREPVLLVDSSVTEAKKPLLFDCGSLGLSMLATEFLRSTAATCVENLAISSKPACPAVSAAVVASSPFAVVEPPPVSTVDVSTVQVAPVCAVNNTADIAASTMQSGASILDQVLANVPAPATIGEAKPAGPVAEDAGAMPVSSSVVDEEMRPVLSTA